MLPKGYAYQSDRGHFDYSFESEGPNGIIKKIARFTYVQDNVFNFAFGNLDEEAGGIADMARSNNEDVETIMSTLGNIVLEFFSKFPNTRIFVQGSTLARTRLYQIYMNKYWQEIDNVLIVRGFRRGSWERFQIRTNYEAFFAEPK